MKREWCAAGRQRRHTIRHGFLRCTRGRYHARDGIAVQCIWTMFVPFGSRALPPSWALSVYSRSLLRHPSRRSNNTLDSPRPLDLPLSRYFSLRSHLFLLLFVFFHFRHRRSTFLVPCSSYSQRHGRVFSPCAFLKYSGSSYTYTMTISRYYHCSRKH